MPKYKDKINIPNYNVNPDAPIDDSVNFYVKNGIAYIQSKDYPDGRLVSAGDMLKETYDTDNDGVIDVAKIAQSVAWNDITNKPTIPVLPTYSTVAISGNYNDLSNKPIIPSSKVATTGDFNDLNNKPVLAVVATSGSYNDLLDKPSAPSGLAAVSISGSYTDLINKPEYSTVAETGNYNDLANKPIIPVIPTLATIATSGNYADLNNKPTIPVLPTLSTVATTGLYSDLTEKPTFATIATSGSYMDLTNKPTIPVLPTFATVATTGNYTDLTNKPTIPVLPTYSTVATSGSYMDLTNKPTIPVLPTYSTVATTGSYNDLSNKPVITQYVLPIATSTVLGGVKQGANITIGADGTISSTAGGTGSVTQVSSANADISVSNETITPILTLNSGVSGNQIVKLDSNAKLPAVNGSQLTNLPSDSTKANLAGGAVFTGAVTLPIGSVSDGLTVSLNATITAAGTTQATATILTKDTNIVTLGTGGVQIQGAATGKIVVIVNKTANLISVYPSTGHYIDALAINTPIYVYAGGFVELYGYSTTQWTTSMNAMTSWNKITGTPTTAAGYGITNVAIMASSASNVLMTTTGATLVSSYAPSTTGNFIVYVSLRVITAMTNVTVNVLYYDAAGGVQTNAILSAQAVAIGSYSCIPVFINENGGQTIAVQIIAGTANQVYVSSSIQTA